MGTPYFPRRANIDMHRAFASRSLVTALDVSLLVAKKSVCDHNKKEFLALRIFYGLDQHSEIDLDEFVR